MRLLFFDTNIVFPIRRAGGSLPPIFNNVGISYKIFIYLIKGSHSGRAGAIGD